ncbi:MAG: succinate dehydrogenase assembly factor 2 [Hyphomicrobiales bacterium]
MTAASDTDAVRRKRLLWRATHRGIKEMDIIFGGFVTRGIEAFTSTELDELERMITLPDQELLSWATRTAAVPAAHDGPLLRAMLSFRP